jgi:hypothetical protein
VFLLEIKPRPFTPRLVKILSPPDHHVSTSFSIEHLTPVHSNSFVYFCLQDRNFYPFPAQIDELGQYVDWHGLRKLEI